MVNTGTSVCSSGTFNSVAIRKEECLPCFCFGQTDSCKSADLYTSTLRMPEGTLQPLDSSYLSRTHTGQKMYVPNAGNLGIQGVPYFSLPNSHIGKMLKSYGGSLRFKTSYRGEGYPMNAPIVIMKVTIVILFIICSILYVREVAIHLHTLTRTKCGQIKTTKCPSDSGL